MKIAITTSNGKSVDLHFGKAKSFNIYELTSEELAFIETRSTGGYCSGNSNHKFKPNKLDAAFEVIKDCEVICTAKIGETPSTKLQEKGLHVVEFEGTIDDVFEKI